MHTPTRRGKPGRSQVLYWYRTPPGVRVGRKPFSEDVQRMLEAQNPGITFDWPAIINTPMPPPDMTEFWREKRRAAKAAKEERRAQEAADVEDDVAEPAQSAAAETDVVDEAGALDDDPDAAAGDDESTSESVNTADSEGGDDSAARKRRRRRGGRRRRAATARPGGDAEGGEVADADPRAEGTALESAPSVEPAPGPTEPVE